MAKHSSSVNQILRNPYRVFNHIDLIKGKITIGQRWGLIQQDLTKASEPLAAMQSFFEKELCLADVFGLIATANGRSADALIGDMESVYATGQVELHITDLCDLDCINCHYKHKSGATIAFDILPTMLASLAPRALTITGGGEPNCYSCHGKTLNDVVLLVHRVLPNTQIGLINNNTRLLPGSWYDHLAWQRTSVDAATPQTYRLIKQIDLYDQVVQNVELLLLSKRVPHVGVGFLYRPENVGEIAEFLDGWFFRFQRLPPDVQQRFNIQFRPIAPPIQQAAAVTVGANYLPTQVVSILRKQVQEVALRAQHDEMFARFLDSFTNFGSIPIDRDPFAHVPSQFTKCYNTLIHRVVRANGDEFPDFLLCELQECALGNTIRGGSLERARIGLAQFHYHNCVTPFCNPDSCRQSWVSSIIEHPDEARVALRPMGNYFF